MDKRCKLSPEKRLEIARLCFDGKMSRAEAAKRFGVDKTSVDRWISCYKGQGADGFIRSGRNKVYSPEVKLQAVHDYLDGKGSYLKVAVKYGIRSADQLMTWVRMYNSGVSFKHNMSGGSRMSTSRKTTKEERIAIAKECISNGKNYGEIALKYNVSYQQVYTWVKRYSELGEAGLEDRRGKRKADQEPRSEVEELKIKMAKLEHELYITKVENDLLKKLDELERRDASRK